MRFSLSRSPRTSRASAGAATTTTASANSVEIPCTYHGWVMLPQASLTNDGSDSGSVSYDRLVDMAKRVGVAQTVKSRNRKPERATVLVNDSAVRVVGKKQDSNAMPLLHASINTVICTLISKRTGVAVIVAHTWDGRGNRGIGCDVVRMKVRGCTTFKSSIQLAIEALNRRNAAAAAAVSTQQAPLAPPPYTAEDELRGQRQTVRRRRRSTVAENDNDGGYMAVEAFLNVDYEEPLECDFILDEGEGEATYMDICGPAVTGNGYMTVEPPAAGGYMDIEPHPFAVEAY